MSRKRSKRPRMREAPSFITFSSEEGSQKQFSPRPNVLPRQRTPLSAKSVGKGIPRFTSICPSLCVWLLLMAAMFPVFCLLDVVVGTVGVGRGFQLSVKEIKHFRDVFFVFLLVPRAITLLRVRDYLLSYCGGFSRFASTRWRFRRGTIPDTLGTSECVDNT